MLRHRGVVHGQEGLIRALAALHPWLLANPRFPLVSAGRGVAALAVTIFPTQRVDVLSPTRQAMEQRDLGCG